MSRPVWVRIGRRSTTRYVKRLDENVGALGVTLSADEVSRISAAVPAAAAAAMRYPEAGMKAVYV